MTITIVGNGVWGKALATLLYKNKQRVVICKRKERIPKSDCIVLALPTNEIRHALRLADDLKGTLIINSAKGIEQKTHRLPFQIVSDIVGDNTPYFSLVGPSFAQEVVSGMPTLVNLGYVQKTHLETVKRLFQTAYFRIKPTASIRALELAGALKNVYAIAAGLSRGLGFGINTRTKLVLLGYEEITVLCRRLGFSILPNASPGILGDLILTCNSMESRNFTFGKLLGTHKVAKALLEVNATVEGYDTIASIPYFAKKSGLLLPLANLVGTIILLNDPSKVRKCFKDFVKSV